MASSFRFDPPQIEVDPELAWVLARAFGPLRDGWLNESRLNQGRAVDLAERLDLTARIGARNPQEALTRKVGEGAAKAFVDAYRQTAAACLAVERLCRELADIGNEADIPIIFLKGAALLVSGRVQAGVRGMSDIDLLTRERDAPSFQERMIQRGWSEVVGPTGEHQLQILTHGSGLGLEVHTMILGVRITGSASASGDDLIDRGLTVPLPDPLEGGAVPVEEVLLAHLLVHGIAQHGLKPQSYPMMRLVADAQDLCENGTRWDELLPAALSWIGSDVALEEAGAVRDLVQRLGGGKNPTEIAGADDRPGQLLRHIIAGVLDDRYCRGLRLRGLSTPVAARSASRTLVKNAFETVWLTRPQIEMLYGKPRTSLGYFGWRLWRPIDLVLRTGRYGWAWMVDRLRR
jgi:hypothetical protein